MNNYCVYKHISPDGKVYVGITKQKLSHRFGNGKGYVHNQYFTRAINKYGWDNFKHEVIADGLSYDEACAREIHEIKITRSTERDYGYNIESGGNATKKISEETKKILSQQRVGVKKGPMDETTKAKLSAIRKTQGNFRTGVRLSEETKRKIGLANKGKAVVVSEETRKKISIALTGIERNDDTRAKISKGQQRSWLNPKRKKSTSRYTPVEQIDVTTGEVINRFASLSEAARETGCTHIADCCKGKRTIGKGYKWRYAV